MHEQQESVSGEVSHCLCRSHSDNMTSLKFTRVLEIQGQITKNHLLRTCSVFLIFWSKNASSSCKWTCSTKRAGNRPRSIYINILACLRGFQDKIFKFLLSLKSQKILGYKEIILKEKLDVSALSCRHYQMQKVVQFSYSCMLV